MSFNRHRQGTRYVPGDHWAVCEVCNMDYRQSDLMLRWDGLKVCKKDFEPRHPLDLQKQKPDKTSPIGLWRSEPTDEFTSVSYCLSTVARAGIANAGCARAGSNVINDLSEAALTIPSGTFTFTDLTPT